MEENEIITEIVAELRRAEAKHPNYSNNMYKQYTIISEEAGEIAKAILHYNDEGGSIGEIKKELIQTAAVCLRMLNYHFPF